MKVNYIIKKYEVIAIPIPIIWTIKANLFQPSAFLFFRPTSQKIIPSTPTGKEKNTLRSQNQYQLVSMNQSPQIKDRILKILKIEVRDLASIKNFLKVHT
jgi:hypothetical protein